MKILHTSTPSLTLAETVLTNGQETLPLDLFYEMAHNIKRDFESAVADICTDEDELQDHRIAHNAMYRSGVTDAYRSWKAVHHQNASSFELNRPKDIMAAWESLEHFMDTHCFPHKTQQITLSSAFYLRYDMHWHLLVDIIQTIVTTPALSAAKKTLQDIFPLNIPTHQRGLSSLQEIAKQMKATYKDPSVLLEDIVTWYKCLIEVSRIYESETFSKRVSEFAKQYPEQKYRDGFANTLHIAKRTIRDIFILTDDKELTYDHRRLAEEYLEHAATEMFEDVKN